MDTRQKSSKYRAFSTTSASAWALLPSRALILRRAVAGSVWHCTRRRRAKLSEWFQVRPPKAVLERGLSDHGDAAFEQEVKHSEEQRQCADREGIARRRLETASGVRHAFLDLIATDRWASDRTGQFVRERGLPRSRWSADDDESRRGHVTLSPCRARHGDPAPRPPDGVSGRAGGPVIRAALLARRSAALPRLLGEVGDPKPRRRGLGSRPRGRWRDARRRRRAGHADRPARRLAAPRQW